VALLSFDPESLAIEGGGFGLAERFLRNKREGKAGN
jgi:hypothetical protein